MAHGGMCSKGGFLKIEDDRATYSAILAGFLAGKNFSVQIDTSLGLAGGGYCGILYVDIKN